MKHARGFTIGLLSLVLLAPPAQAERPRAGAPSTAEERRASWARHQELEAASPFAGLPWRSIGPVIQGGRIVDIETVPGEPYSYYVAYASGGLWKTENNGLSFAPLFDDQATIIMGDIAVDPNAPETIWVGSGENNSSRSSYGGAGVFRSTDGGGSWQNLGLWETDRIGRLLIDPRDGNHVLVAALGRLYSEGGTRGVFRTTDGGKSWQNVLPGEGMTGAIDLVRDASNPDTVYAATWDRSRRPWNFVEGGPGTGVWKSTDNGATWRRLRGGLPEGEHAGRIGLAISDSRPQTLYVALDNQEPLPEELWDLGGGAVTAKRLRKMSKEEFLQQDPQEIEAFIRGSDLDPELDADKLLELVREDEVTIADLLAVLEDANANLFNTDIRGIDVWRSDDGGESWRRTHDEPLRQVVHTYGYYFGQIRVAPDDPDRIYLAGVPLVASDDGGKSWRNINEPGVHVDHHAMWINPEHPQHLVLGNDGGFYQSYDGGKSWLTQNPISVGQFYTIMVDDAEPYNVYGGLQDNGTLKGSSRTRPGISGEWSFIGGGDGMYVQIDPRDGTTYVGFQFGYYQRIGADGSRSRVRPRNKLKEPALRYNWATPVLLSPHNADIVYFGANKLFRSLDKGETWTAISDDLTRSQERGDVPYGTITSVDESAQRFGLLWAGTDDGQLWVSDDGGAQWRDAGAGLPAERWVSRVEASATVAERAYVTLNGYRDDDMRAYVYVTEDLGKSWSSIAAGLPAEPVNVIREDPVNDEVLYVGTDRGVYVSLDRGGSWHALQGGLPNVPVHDLVVHPRERELVAGTHGRSVWIVDVLPVQEWSGISGGVERKVHVFPLEKQDYRRSWASRRSLWWDREENRPWLDIAYRHADGGTATLEIVDDDDNVLRRMELDSAAGANVARWDLLLDEELALPVERERLAPKEDKKKKRGKSKDAAEKKEPTRAEMPWSEAVRLERPLYVTPGKYKVRITAGGQSAETELEIGKPRPLPPRTKKKPRIRGERDDDGA